MLQTNAMSDGMQRWCIVMSGNRRGNATAAAPCVGTLQVALCAVGSREATSYPSHRRI
jgi:hypothetical protein